MKKTTVLKSLLVMAVLAALTVSSAHATAALQIFDGASCATSNCVTINGNTGATISSNGIASSSTTLVSSGYIVSVVVLGTSFFTINTETAQTKPFFSAGNFMNLTTNNATLSGAGTVHIWWSDQDFSLQPATVHANAGGTIHNPTVSATYNTYWDPGNTLFGLTNLMTSQGPFTGASFSGSAVGGAIVGSPYSLTQELVLTFTGPGSLSGDFSLTVVPEPASVLLLGGVVLLSVRAIRRRAKQAA